MNIPVRLKNIKEYFDFSLVLLNPILKMSNTERNIISTYLMLAYNNRHIEEDQMYKLLFNASTRKKVRESLKLSEASFNNNICSLRRKGLIVTDVDTIKLNKNLLYVYPDRTTGSFNINYNLIIDSVRDNSSVNNNTKNNG